MGLYGFVGLYGFIFRRDYEIPIPSMEMVYLYYMNS